MKRLQHLSWDEAQSRLDTSTLIVIPLGAALKEHERKEQAAARRAAPSSFLVDEKLQVTESSESDFLAVLEESRRKP